jgi:hypothetical protein
MPFVEDFNFTISTYIILSLIVIIILILLQIKLKAFNKKRVLRKRFKRGLYLEDKAKEYLSNIGFNIIEEQRSYYHTYKVNGINNKAKIIVDYIVEKGGKRYIVEVKSGKSAISTNNKNTRRQLLEYDFVLENDGIFLLDMENKNMQLIEFTPNLNTKKHNNHIILIVTSLIILIGIFTPNIQIKIAAILLLSLIVILKKNIL